MLSCRRAGFRLCACVESETDPSNAGDGKGDRWNAANDPANFDLALDYKLDELPACRTSGECEAARTPWAETYWPTYHDSTNHRWQGPMIFSPLEKYDQAFNGWAPPAGFAALRPYDPALCTAGTASPFDRSYYDELGPAASFQSHNKGNWNMHNGTDDDQDGQIDECDDQDGVETWWGLCHAWSPAAITEDEPLHAATVGGIVFEPSDIKALLITQYDKSTSRSLGGRCNDKDVHPIFYGFRSRRSAEIPT